MAKVFKVSASHPCSAEYTFKDTLVTVRSSLYSEGIRYWADHPKLGCGKNYVTEKGAVYGLFNDHACSVTAIDEGTEV